MRTFADKPKETPQNKTAQPTKTGGALSMQSRNVHSTPLHIQRTIGNQGVQRLHQNNIEETSAIHDGEVPDQVHGQPEASIGQITKMATSGPGEALPFAAQIRASFGPHEVPAIAHTDAAAVAAATTIGATAFTKGRDMVFAAQPTLRVAAHEAAHVVQQRSGIQIPGGFGKKGDMYEQQADAVADRVVSGRSCQDLLGAYGGTKGNRSFPSPAIQCLGQSLPYVGPALSYLNPLNQARRVFMTGLSQPQITLLNGIFGNSLATSVIRLNPNSILASGNCFRTTGNVINMPGTTISDSTLIHEAAHVWQSQNSIFGVEYAVSALKNMAIAQILGGDWQRAYDYTNVERYRIPWRYWNAEQQASWIEDNRRLPSGWMLQSVLPDFGVIESTGLE